MIDAGGAPPVGAAAQPRRSALLILLLRAGGRGISREKILSLLWPDTPEDRGRRTLAQALYALRRDLGVADAILGAGTLRINPDVVTADVTEFERAIVAGDFERAVGLYGGPFLDGFALPDAPEFERWLDEERRSLAASCVQALKRLARAATAAGDPGATIRAWQRVTKFDPVDTQATLEVMRAFRAAGDPSGALRYAQEYEQRLAGEYELPPSPDVRALASELRTTLPKEAAGPEVPAPGQEWREGVGALSSDPSPLLAPRSAHRSWRPAAVIATLLILVLSAALVWRWRRQPATLPSLVIGQITDRMGTGAGMGVGGTVRELLATDLARASGIAVVSSARVYDLLMANGRLDDTTRAGYLLAARRAGAAHLFDGSIFELPNGRYRLDLRRIDPATGLITADRSVTGTDLFAMVDTLALWVASGLGSDRLTFAPRTRSLEAFRWYQEGMRAYSGDDRQAATGHFTKALEFDSNFAMAAYYRALVAADPATIVRSLNRANELAATLNERDRLMVTLAWSQRNRPARALRIADSLATRYPAEIEGHLARGQLLYQAGEVRAALTPLHRALEMSLEGAAGEGRDARIAEIGAWLVTSYVTLDSIPAALREARRWVARQPRSARAQLAYAWALQVSGEVGEAEAALRAAEALPSLTFSGISSYDGLGKINGGLLDLWMALGEYDRITEYFVGLEREWARSGTPANDAWTIGAWRREVMRQRGQLHSARQVPRAPVEPTDSVVYLLQDARDLAASGDLRGAVRLYDSLAAVAHESQGTPAAINRRVRSVYLMYAAEPLAELGDTAGLRQLVASVRELVPEEPSVRDEAPLHHVTGIWLLATGHPAKAESEFRAALYSPVQGHTWTNVGLARALMRQGRAREAIPPLNAALRRRSPSFVAMGAYAPRPVVYDHLAVAWEMAGEPDSARAARSRRDRLWTGHDPMLVLHPAALTVRPDR